MVAVLTVSTSVSGTVLRKPSFKPGLSLVKKAPRLWLGAFFMLAGFSAGLAAESLCPAVGPIQWYQLERVVDGDTLYLEGGLKVRVLGINTPEIGRGKPDQPLAQQSRLAVEGFFAAKQRVGLQVGDKPKDNYGRTLAHVFNQHGDSLAAHLLAGGLGWLVVIAPNTDYADCLAGQRQRARALGRGVWSISDYAPLNSTHLQAGDAGFRQVRGKIVKVTKSRNSWWLETGKLAIRIKQSDLQYFDGREPSALQGKTVTVSGWIIDRSDAKSVIKKGYPPFMVNVSHSLMLQH